MKKNTIVQFVCFSTILELEDFSPEWERYAKRLTNKKTGSNLQQLVVETKNRYRYISQHEWPNRDFHFTFMDERKSEHFPGYNVKVVQAGGYIPLRQYKRLTGKGQDNDVNLIALIGHAENDIEFYNQLPYYHRLNIYQAFFESCLYGYILEFQVPENHADEFLHHLQQRPSIETGIYRECLLSLLKPVF